MRRGSELPRAKISEFLEKKGSVHLLEMIGTDGGSWNEIVEEIPISQSTLTQRLGEAEELGLINQSLDRTDSNTKKKYTLTRKLGEPIFQEMVTTQLKATARSIRYEQQRFKKQKQELAEWAESGRLDEIYTAREQQQETDDS